MTATIEEGGAVRMHGPEPSWNIPDPDRDERERDEFERFARVMMRIQRRNRKAAPPRGVPHRLERAFHAKATFAVDGARLEFVEDLPDDLTVGFARPGATYPVMIRFSNTRGQDRPDYEKDLRGVALRITDEQTGEVHDLLLGNTPASHARDARQFVQFATAVAGGPISIALGVTKLLLRSRETRRMVRDIRKARTNIDSVATETYWSRGAIAWGRRVAVRYLLEPPRAVVKGDMPPAARKDPDYLAHEAAARLAAGDIVFHLYVQRFEDEETTPIEDTSRVWGSPPQKIAVLTIPQRADHGGPAGVVEPKARTLDFNPWNTTDEFRPLGNLNRARKAAYEASAAYRHGFRFESRVPLRNRAVRRMVGPIFRLVNHRWRWDRLGVQLGLLNLDMLRHQLRQENLFDTERPEAPPVARDVAPPPPADDVRTHRTVEGCYNDLSAPKMGAVGATFGRNLKVVPQPDLYDVPNPVDVSCELLTRKRFIPATSLNLLAAAWIQFQVHDWARHKRYALGADGGKHDVVVPLPGSVERVMRIAGNIPAPGGSEDHGPFENDVSHWWDGSELYGGNEKEADDLRTGSRLLESGPENLLHARQDSADKGLVDGWWLGLGGVHQLFIREHNVLCDELERRYPRWKGDRVYDTARLIVSALIAKIHTLEWTPAILDREVVSVGMRTNWSGPPARDWLLRLGLWLADAPALKGIRGSDPDHFGVPFSMTEEFISVYRMHPLLPDDYVPRDHLTGKADAAPLPFGKIQGAAGQARLARTVNDVDALPDVLYSLGVAHPGALVLHNYPTPLRNFQRGDEFIDLAVVDLVRDRRRGIPRYNDFRAGLHLPRIKDFAELDVDHDTRECMRALYKNDVDMIDTMIGLYAERPPDGFGFSDTAFRVFVLMAARRLQSDRFLTVDFRPEIYTRFGIDWIDTNDMTSVIQRHCPDLAARLPRGANPFAPWRPVGQEV